MTQFNNFDNDEFKEWFYIRDITHHTFYNLKTFEYIAHKYNYEIIYTDNKNKIVLRKGNDA